MAEIVTMVPGLFPLPDWAKESLADLKGHQRQDLISGDESKDITDVYSSCRADVIELQQQAELDRLCEGQLRWDDILAHPLAVNDAVETRGLQRYYDNNNFYREPVVSDELTVTGDIAEELSAARNHTDSLQAVIPGPYTLADLATNDYYADADAFLTALSEYLAAEVAEFPPHDPLLMLEPSLVTDPPSAGEHELLIESIDRIVEETGAVVVVHTYWDAPDESTYAHLVDSDIDAIGLDFVTAPEENLHLLSEFGSPGSVALGLLDGQNTEVESATALRERIETIESRLPGMTFDRIYVTTNTELFYLPTNKFEAKLSVLGAIGTEAIAQ